MPIIPVIPIRHTLSERDAVYTGVHTFLKNLHSETGQSDHQKAFSPKIQPPNSEIPSYCDKIVDVEIYPNIILRHLEAIKTNKNPGPESIYPHVLCEARRALAVPLSCIFRKSVDSGQLPQDWKNAYICATYKKGPRTWQNTIILSIWRVWLLRCWRALS